jgi:hypothetical protein
LHGDCTAISKKLLGDFKSIAQRFQIDCALIAQLLRSDRASIVQQVHNDCTAITLSILWHILSDREEIAHFSQ